MNDKVPCPCAGERHAQLDRWASRKIVPYHLVQSERMGDT